MSHYDASSTIAIYATCDSLSYAGPWIGQLGSSDDERTASGSDALREALVGKVWAAAYDASSDGWDGAGSVAVRQESLARAIQVVSFLPVEMLASADVSVTPSGTISFDWDTDPQNQLSIMLTANNTISYAAYRPQGRTHGALDFQHLELPEEITLAIRKWRG